MEIRNFCILAHIDHGKSTLADRFLEITGAVEKRKMREQFLDMHPLERERGITIKMAPVRMSYVLNAIPYTLNLIDTPGHVDFAYEVSRALAAVEGAIILVDATQGIQAQTIANLRRAQEQKLVIIPVINKIDLPFANAEKTADELGELLGVPADDISRISAKTGAGVEDLLREVIARIPPPATSSRSDSGHQPLRALVFDSQYEPYLGVIAHVRIFNGAVRKGDAIRFLATKAEVRAEEVGVFLPGRSATDEIGEGEIGYIATGIKEPEHVRVGDTITTVMVHGLHRSNRLNDFDDFNISNVKPLPGYQEPAPVVWASLFPEDQDEYEHLREALQKLQLEDAALTFVPEAGGILGRGFRAGFLGMLHMEIISERIAREYAIRVIFSRPSVSFRVRMRTPSGDAGKEIAVYAADMFPDPHLIERIEEPWVALDILTPSEFLGALTSLIHDRGGYVGAAVSRGPGRLQISAAAPMREIVLDFYDTLKSMTHGFASLAYAPAGWRLADLVRLDISVVGKPSPALSEIVPRDRAYAIGRARVEKLKTILPARLFAIPLQASVEGRIIARETIPALKKDVTGYLYGGDRTRKMKLWKKQQRGKKRLQESAHVDIPPEVFFKILAR